MFITGIKLDEIGTTSYINELPVVRHLLTIPRVNLTTPVTFVVGENGSGKSTLVEAIAVGSGFNAEGGTRQVTFSTMNTESELHHWLTVVRAKNPTWGSFCGRNPITTWPPPTTNSMRRFPQRTG